LCSLAICPVRSRDGAIALYIIDFDDPTWKEEEEEEKNTNTTCKLKKDNINISLTNTKHYEVKEKQYRLYLS
jgi:hypothetical protein